MRAQRRLEQGRRISEMLIERWPRLEPHLRDLVAEVITRCVPEEDLDTESDLCERLQKLDGLKEVVEQTVRIEVQQLRRFQSVSWEHIGAYLGMTRQGARQKYQHPADVAIAEAEELWTAEVENLVAQLKTDMARVNLEAARRLCTAEEADSKREALQRQAADQSMKLIDEHLERLKALRAEAHYGDE